MTLAILDARDKEYVLVAAGADLLASYVQQAIAAGQTAQEVLDAILAAGLSEGVFPSLAAGESGTTDGQYFWVGDAGTVVLYRNDAGVGTEIAELATAASVAGKVDASALASSTGAGMSGARHGETYVIGSLGDRFSKKVCVSDEPFNARGDCDGSSGSGTDNSAAINAAFTYAVQHGLEVVAVPGRYRTTQPIIIDRSGNNQDPINGGMFGMNLTGGGPASCQIVADHSGNCIEFRGGAGAGWHTFFRMDGIGLLRAGANRSAGSIGLKIDQSAYLRVADFDVYGFEKGIYGTDVLASEFENGNIRGNSHGFQFIKGTRSHPNAIMFKAVKTLNNIITGGTLEKPSSFAYIGGTIESNGYTGVLADPDSWGLKITSAGTEGAIGLDMTGTYIENNNGIADIWILQTANAAMHCLRGVGFLRLASDRYVTQNILFSAGSAGFLILSGCGFKSFAPYVDDAARPFIGGSDSRIYDGGGNMFRDASGGKVGVRRSVFAPLGAEHSLPFAALPAAADFRNSLQYVADGGGGTLNPSLAVSTGTKWEQIVLGQYAGNVAADGTASTLPRGWTCAKISTGVYEITHNLGIAGTQYSIVATAKGGSGTSNSRVCTGYAVATNNKFEIYFGDMAGSQADSAFTFMVARI